MKLAIALAALLVGAAASAQDITITPNPGNCIGNRCGYLGSDGSRITPNPNGGWWVSRPPQLQPPPHINIPQINPYANRDYNRGYNQDDSDDDQ